MMSEEVEAVPINEMEDNGRNPETGQFVKGWKGGPGRPKGSVDFMQALRLHAKAKGYDIVAAVWEVAEAMFEKAKSGDVAAAKLILDRACGVQNKGADVEVNVDARQVRIGPPIPEGQKLDEFIEARRVHSGLGAGVGAEQSK
jgi:hypothetical protein